MYETGAIDALFECSQCGNRFGTSECNMSIREQCKSEDGRSIQITYYDCPKCGKRHYVQVDNAHSVELLSAVSKLFVRIASTKAKGKAIPAALQDKYTKKNNHLRRCRTRLMHEWNGKVVFGVGTGQAHELHFLV